MIMEAVREGLQSGTPGYAQILEELTTLGQQLTEWIQSLPEGLRDDEKHNATKAGEEDTVEDFEMAADSNPQTNEDWKESFTEVTQKIRDWLTRIENIIERCATLHPVPCCRIIAALSQR